MINKSIADEMEFEDTLYRLQMENNNKQEITTNGKYQQTGNNNKWLIQQMENTNKREITTNG